MLDLKTGNTVGVYAASAVAIRKVGFGKSGAVRVACDENDLFLSGKAVKALLRLLLSGIVFGGAGRIKDAVMLQGFPEVSDKKAGKAPERGIK